MRLSDAGLRRRKMRLIYPDHRPSPCPNADGPRDRSNRLLGCYRDLSRLAVSFGQSNLNGKFSCIIAPVTEEMI
jgi:hypothetical protein